MIVLPALICVILLVRVSEGSQKYSVLKEDYSYEYEYESHYEETEEEEEVEERSLALRQNLLETMQSVGMSQQEEEQLLEALDSKFISYDELQDKLDLLAVQNKWQTFVESGGDRSLTGDLDSSCKKFADDMLSSHDLKKQEQKYIGMIEAQMQDDCFMEPSLAQPATPVPTDPSLRCFAGYGCFGKDFPEGFVRPHDPTIVRPELVFTHKTLPDIRIKEGDISELLSVIFRRRPKKLAFILHGFLSDVDDPSDTIYYQIKDALTETTEYENVVVMKYKTAVSEVFRYNQAMANSEVVGVMLGKIIYTILGSDFTKRNKLMTGKDIYLIGFSMGNQVAHFASKHLRAEHGILIGRITALDPARIRTRGLQVTKEDAEFVDVIHTSAHDWVPSKLQFQFELDQWWQDGRVGIMEAIGHLDFYPNGGGYQPYCGFLKHVDGPKSRGICHHEAALKYFLRSFNRTSDHINCPYSSYACFGLAHPNSYPDQMCGKWWPGNAPVAWSEIPKMGARMGFESIHFSTRPQVQLLFTSTDEERMCDTHTPCHRWRCSPARNIRISVGGANYYWPPCKIRSIAEGGC